MRRQIRIAAIGIAAALASITALCGTALAAPGWTAPANYSIPADALASTVHIAYQTGGTATIAYLSLVSQSPLQTVLHVGTIAPGGAYREQLQIPSTASATPADLTLAESPDGAAVVEWADLQGSSINSPYTYMASYRAASSSSWESPATIATDTTTVSGISEYLAAAISAGGTAAAGIDHVDPTIPSPGGYRIDVAVHPAGGSWGTTTQISAPSDSSEGLVLGFDSGGDLTAAWRQEMSNSRYTLIARTRTASTGLWNSADDVTGSDPTSDAEGPVLGMAADGSAVIAFQYVHYSSPNTLDVNAVTRSGQNGAWSSVADVAPGGASSAPETAGVSPTDKAYVLYTFQGSNSGLDCVGVARSSIGSAWSSPQCVSPVNFQSSGLGGLAFLGDDAYFAWSGQPNGGSDYVVEGSRWRDGGPQPDSATDLESPSSSIGFDTLVPDQDGSVAAFWSLQGTLRAAAYDAGGPNLISASIPTSARPHRRVTMSATFVDLWAGLGGAASWTFGDGATGSGAEVSHAYARPGVYTVTVKSADALGNQTIDTYRISVIGPPTLSAVGQSARKWRERKGTTFRFRLSQPAAVALTFRRSRGTRRVTVGTLRLAVKQGTSRVRFHGTLGRRKLSPGSYTVAIAATNSVGERSRTRTLSFTITGR